MRLADRVGSSAETRVPLSRDRVLRAAVALADIGGVDSITMRKLGQELGVEAMSLYNHVANKDDILNGITDLVLGEIDLSAGGTDWKTDVRALSISTHRALMRHPWACSLMLSTDRVIPARLRWMEALLRSLRVGGFSANATHHAYHVLDSYITGFTLWIATMAIGDEDLADLAADFLPGLPIDEYPYLVEHIEQHLLPPDPDDRGEFSFGLDLILDGLERFRDRA